MHEYYIYKNEEFKEKIASNENVKNHSHFQEKKFFTFSLLDKKIITNNKIKEEPMELDSMDTMIELYKKILIHSKKYPSYCNNNNLYILADD